MTCSVQDFLEHAVQILDTDPRSKSGFAAKTCFRRKTRGRGDCPVFHAPCWPRRNLICVSALYRRTDWERVGGYCEELVGYEDWDFLAVDFQGGQSRAIILSGHSLSHSQRLEAHRRPQTQTRNNRLAEPPSCGIFRTSALRTAALSTYMVETAESADEMGS